MLLRCDNAFGMLALLNISQRDICEREITGPSTAGGFGQAARVSSVPGAATVRKVLMRLSCAPRADLDRVESG